MSNRTKAILALGGVFLFGTLCGYLIMGIVVRDRVRESQSLRDRTGFEAYFADRLKLTEGQRDSLRDELEQTYDELAGLRRSTAEEYHELLDTLDRRIASQLSAEQRELLRREEQRFLRQVVPGPGPRPHPPVRGSEVGRTEEPPPPPVAQGSRDTAPKQNDRQAPNPRSTASIDSNRAAPASSPAPGFNGFARLLRDSVGLTPQQFREVQRIVMMTRQRVDEIASDSLSYPPRMKRAALGRNLREMDAGISSLLTEEQMAKYSVIRERFRKAIRQRIIGRMREGPGD
jgi:hypothetical protein